VSNGKGQAIRLLDVALIGPVMIVSAWTIWTAVKDRDILAGLLAVFGVGTVLYNARNYIRFY
jgi:hypothetical protein